MTANTDIIALSREELRKADKYNSAYKATDSGRPDEFKGQRLVDFGIATALIALMSPIILLRAAL